jgi:putative ABC transport system permease protein
VNAFLRRVQWLLWRSKQEAELREELQFHLEEDAEQRERDGLATEEACWAAKRGLGNVTLVKEDARAAWIPVWLDQAVQDAGYGLRVLHRSPGFAAAAVLMLALGIGINAAVFTVAKAALLSGFPLVKTNDRLLYLTTTRYCCVSYPDFVDWRAQAKSFAGMALVHGVQISLSDQGEFPENYQATEVTADTFKLVGQRPIIGRDFESSDETPGAAPVAILSYGFWERRYGRDRAIVGRTIRINGTATAVIGIMPRGFLFPQKQELWVPLIPTSNLRKRENRETWFVFGRLADDATENSARVEMETIGKRLASAYPLTNWDIVPMVQNFHEMFIDGNEAIVYECMWGAVGFVLLIACANLANLMLGRAVGRSREIAARMALGAGRWRVVRQLLVESAMLSAVGGVLGWWIAKWGVEAYALADRGPGRASWRILDYSMDYRVLGYVIAISIGTALLFGLAPALRLSKLDINMALKDGGHGALSGSSGWGGKGHGKHLSALLVSGEVALAVVLLAGAGVMIRSFLNIYAADIGVKTENVLTMNLALPVARYPTAEAQKSFFDRLKARLEAVPGVESVALASTLPTFGSRRFPYELAGVETGSANDEERRPKLSALVVGPDYFRTLGAAVVSGREFDDADGVSGVPIVIVNQRFASTHWPGEDPLGKRLRLFYGKTPQAWLTVVGVVPNIVQNDSRRQEFDPLIYVPYRQKGSAIPARVMEVIARTRVSPASLTPAFRREVQMSDSDLPIFGPFTLAQRLEGNYWSNGLYGVLFVIFAAMALLLASTGLYAVIAHSVSRRTQEIGIRMAIGAAGSDILRLVLRQGMLPLGVGLAIGLAGSFALNRVLKAMLVDVSPADPITLMAASGVLILAAMFGCLIPAVRATRVDPAEAVRHE